MSKEFARLITPPELPDLEFMHARFNGQTFVPHSHSYLSITLILEGHWLSRHSGVPHTARAGQIGIVNCEEIHDGLSLDPDGSTYLKLAVGTEILQEIGSLFGSSTRWVPVFTEPVIRDVELAGRLLDRFNDLDSDRESSGRTHEALDLVAAFIRRHASSWREHPRELPGHQAIRSSLDFIHRHRAEDIRPADLVEISGLSRFHFIRVFREFTGLTPHAYLTQVRLERAQQLLDTGLSIREVATTCGYVDQSHFTNRFKQLYGFTPGEYLRAHAG